MVVRAHPNGTIRSQVPFAASMFRNVPTPQAPVPHPAPQQKAPAPMPQGAPSGYMDPAGPPGMQGGGMPMQQQQGILPPRTMSMGAPQPQQHYQTGPDMSKGYPDYSHSYGYHAGDDPALKPGSFGNSREQFGIGGNRGPGDPIQTGTYSSPGLGEDPNHYAGMAQNYHYGPDMRKGYPDYSHSYGYHQGDDPAQIPGSFGNSREVFGVGGYSRGPGSPIQAGTYHSPGLGEDPNNYPGMPGKLLGDDNRAQLGRAGVDSRDGGMSGGEGQPMGQQQGSPDGPGLNSLSQLPYDPAYTEAIRALDARKSAFHAGLDQRGANLRLQAGSAQRDLHTQQPKDLQALLESFSGRGMSHSGRYATEYGSTQDQYANQNSGIDQSLAAQLSALASQTANYDANDLGDRGNAQQNYIRSLAARAGELGQSRLPTGYEDRGFGGDDGGNFPQDQFKNPFADPGPIDPNPIPGLVQPVDVGAAKLPPLAKVPGAGAARRPTAPGGIRKTPVGRAAPVKSVTPARRAPVPTPSAKRVSPRAGTVRNAPFVPTRTGAKPAPRSSGTRTRAF